MARFDSAINGPASIHVVQDGEFFIVGPEHHGMIIQYNSNSWNAFGIGLWSDGYEVPAGTIVTISTLDQYCYLNLEDSNMPIYGAGWGTTYPYWYLPPYTIGTIVKLDDADTWIISGAGLGQD